MHIRKATITNVRSIRKLTYAIPASKATGWHVILGDNGSGKSTLLKAISLAVVGASDANGLRQPWNDWLTRGQASGGVDLEVGFHKTDDKFSGKGKTPAANALLDLGVKFERSEIDDLVTLNNTTTTPDPKRHVWIHISTIVFREGACEIRRSVETGRGLLRGIGRCDNCRILGKRPNSVVCRWHEQRTQKEVDTD